MFYEITCIAFWLFILCFSFVKWDSYMTPIHQEREQRAKDILKESSFNEIDQVWLKFETFKLVKFIDYFNSYVGSRASSKIIIAAGKYYEKQAEGNK